MNEVYITYGIIELAEITKTPATRLRNAFKCGDIPNESGVKKYEASIQTVSDWKRGLRSETRKMPLAQKFRQ